MKLWLTGMTNAGNVEHLRESIEPIKEYFDGFVYVFHTDDLPYQGVCADDGFRYLSELPNSKVILAPWCKRFDFSRNIGLYHGPIEYGDWFMVIDTMERMDVDFAEQIKDLIGKFEQNGIDGVFLRNKHFLFKFNEKTAFVHNPHCGVAGINRSLEITSLPFWKEEYWLNVRSLHRDKYEFVDHNLKYYLIPNTNHLVLKCEGNVPFLTHRYQVRSMFLHEMDRLEIPISDFEAVKDYMINGELTDTVKQCIREEKYLNDVYRFYRLKRLDIEEDFDFENLVEVE